MCGKSSLMFPQTKKINYESTKDNSLYVSGTFYITSIKNTKFFVIIIYIILHISRNTKTLLPTAVN